MKNRLVILLAIPVIFSSFSAFGEARRDGGADDPMRRAQLMIRQLSQQKSSLEAENAKLNQDIQGLNGQLEKLESQIAKMQKKLASSSTRNEQLTDRVKSDIEKFKQLADRFRETSTKLAGANRDNTHLIKAVEERETWINQCHNKNNEMFNANQELLTLYENKSAWDTFKQKENVVGLAKVDLENQLQEYEFKIEDLKTITFRPTLDHQAYNRSASE